MARIAAQAGAAAALVLDVQTLLNLRLIHDLSADAREQVGERVSILIPMRNEASRLRPCVEAVLGQEGVEDLEIVILDDGSTDGTSTAIRAIVGSDPRVKLIESPDEMPPAGWYGKPWACHRLGEAATGSTLVFIDADVVLAPRAVAQATSLMREIGVELVSPYPRQEAGTWLERLTQPMVNWSWIATLPMVLARGRRPRWSAAIGQFLVVDAAAYRASGGHEAVAGHVVEDVQVVRALKRQGYRGLPVIGGQVASCRMYTGAADTVDGYTKSLWSVFGSAPRALGAAAAMLLIYVVPPAAMIGSRDPVARRWGAIGYSAGVLGRVAAGRRTRERVWPDALAMPGSAGAFAALTIASMVRHRRGSLTWKGRAIT